MSTNTTHFELYKLITQHFEDVIEQVMLALRAAGFEILAEINLSQVLEKKAQAHLRPHKIFVVCNPDLAYTALTIAPQSGALLLCNVDVAHLEDEQVEVRVEVPLAELGAALEPHLKPIADDLTLRLEHVIHALKG